MVENASESQLQSEIEALKVKHTDTRELYQAVCSLLFFGHGITPTANMLYQRVRRGSMSVPCAALNQFWVDLREKSRVTIEGPDLPDPVKAATVTLLRSIWDEAVGRARAGYATQVEELAAHQVRCNEQVEAAQKAELATRLDLSECQQALEVSLAQNRTLAESLAAERAVVANLTVQLEARAVEVQEGHLALERAHEAFAQDLKGLQAQAQLADERMRAAEQHYLVELDRARQGERQVQAQLDQARTQARAEAAASQERNAALQAELLVLRQQAGLLEGRLEATVAQGAVLAEDLRTARDRIEALSAAKALARASIDQRTQQIEELERALAAEKRRADQPIRYRKPHPPA